MNPKYPVYVISKGRWKSRLTVRALLARGVPHKVVIEPQEYDQYAAVIDPSTILVLPFSNLGQGSIPARNWVWEDAITTGAERHWILDDNIQEFRRFNRNAKIQTADGTIFRCCEDFTDRYENVAISGMQYEMFTPRRNVCSPLTINTRIYSCILLRNDLPYRWRGRYNEDTDLSLRALKDGWCTILFRAFLANKIATMRMPGGNTDELYQGNGRYKMAKALQELHPDVTKVVRKWGRWQHQVDYRPFQKNKLVLKPGFVEPTGPNEYGMRVLTLDGKPSVVPGQPVPVDITETEAGMLIADEPGPDQPPPK